MWKTKCKNMSRWIHTIKYKAHCDIDTYMYQHTDFAHKLVHLVNASLAGIATSFENANRLLCVGGGEEENVTFSES